MLRPLLIALSGLVAFDHFIGNDKGVLYLAALLQHLLY
jgi:hypothetical protein